MPRLTAPPIQHKKKGHKHAVKQDSPVALFIIHPWYTGHRTGKIITRQQKIFEFKHPHKLSSQLPIYKAVQDQKAF